MVDQIQMLKTAAQAGDIDELYGVIREDPHVLEHIDKIPFADTPLHIVASSNESSQTLQFLSEIMRLKPSFAWKQNQQGYTPIHLALQRGNKRMVERFIDINKDLVRVKGRECVTPLHLASEKGQTDLLKKFLKACPDSIKEATAKGETALHFAIKNKQHDALEVLLGWLKKARHRGALSLEKTILDSKDEEGNTIFHIPAQLTDSEALERYQLRSSKTTLMDYIRSIREDVSNDHRDSFLVVAALLATATYQTALSPPGGVYQASAGDDNIVKIQRLFFSNLNHRKGQAGTTIMPILVFYLMWFLNTVCFLAANLVIYALMPTGVVGVALYASINYLVAGYFCAMMVLSPNRVGIFLNLSLLILSLAFVNWRALKAFFLWFIRKLGIGGNSGRRIY